MLKIFTLSFMILIGLSGSTFGEEQNQQDSVVWTKQTGGQGEHVVGKKIDSWAAEELYCGTDCFAPFNCFWVRGGLLFFKPCFGNFLCCRFGSTDTMMTTETPPIDDSNQRLTATGPVAGIGADWNLGCGFGIHAFADAALVYGKDHVFQRYFDYNLINGYGDFL